MYTLKVLLADDHDSFRRILSSSLKSQQGIEIIGESADDQEAVEATKTITNHLPSMRVFILSMDISEICQKNVRECADGFIAKSSIKNAILSILSFEQQLHREAMVANVIAA
jgi:DNA-binding NarL/FixJ family response regulator